MGSLREAGSTHPAYKSFVHGQGKLANHEEENKGAVVREVPVSSLSQKAGEDLYLRFPGVRQSYPASLRRIERGPQGDGHRGALQVNLGLAGNSYCIRAQCQSDVRPPCNCPVFGVVMHSGGTGAGMTSVGRNGGKLPGPAPANHQRHRCTCFHHATIPSVSSLLQQAMLRLLLVSRLTLSC